MPNKRSSCQTQNTMKITTTRATRTATTTTAAAVATQRQAETLRTDKIHTNARATNTSTNTIVATTSHRKQNIRRVRNAVTAPSTASTSTATATTVNLRSTRRLCLLLLYTTMLAAHAALASTTNGHKTISTTRPTITIIRTTTTTTTRRRPITVAANTPQYSQRLLAPQVVSAGAANVNGDSDSFRPIIPIDLTPEDISRNVFTPNGQYRVFESAESDLRATSTMRHHDDATIDGQQYKHNSINTQQPTATDQRHTNINEIPTNTDKELEALLSEYVQNFFEKGSIEPLPGLVFALQKNGTHMGIATPVMHNIDDEHELERKEERELLIRHVRNAVHVNARNGGNVSVNIPRALQSGRLLFFAGLKKVLWPIFMGLQILKSLLFALLLPTLIGSVGKLLGKGIISGSAPLFIRPMDAPQEVDFKDNSLNFDDDNKFAMGDFEGTKDDSYAYNQPEASQTHNQYVFNAAGINQQALSRYGNEKQHMQDSYLSALQSLSSASFKNSNSISGSSSAAGLGGLGGALGGGLGGGGGGVSLTAPTRNNKPAAPANVNTFQTFQKVPASSLLLSNYDPFYSPLLSRLDSVFAQLKLNSESEVCREKLICLMYANPAKYAPYSNLVSAQLSRELNELRKPTSDNPDILRFFKYMRAAKDGQDGIDCEKTFDGCDEFKDFENPAMVSTYNDINKLVQARKLT